MSKGHNHDNFLPSPFSVVTAYENKFIEEFNKNIAISIKDVLKYIAKVTAQTIKEENTKQ